MQFLCAYMSFRCDSVPPLNCACILKRLIFGMARCLLLWPAVADAFLAIPFRCVYLPYSASSDNCII